ncbi:hypothetical protein ASD52_14315 [Ensifer sp. Root142]|uniref:aldose 1-epimerase family protein n=1 Tax=Ensifer sp. Root142 TaxID=1736461 RepID=UPI00070A2AAC|nr:aldose 1-epimerase family protein [Ensifer sp. Root142]KQY63360.1 hypothetical protein ASD52_14315 [Ensifer sp. Root142]
MDDTVTITSGAMRAEIALLGAELLSLRLGGHELLWEADAASWSGTSPILFPVIGRVNDGVVRIAGKPYPMPPHGFARQAKFTIEKRASDQVVLVRAENDESLRSYPFRFVLKVTYFLAAGGLQITFDVINTGEDALPYAIGFHPGFRWPFAQGDKDGYSLALPTREKVSGSRLTSAGLMDPARYEVPLADGRLALTEELFYAGALCLLDLDCTSASYVSPDGSSIELSWQNFSHLALWAKTDAPFLCIQPWTGYSDPLGFDKDMFEKPAMHLLEPAAQRQHGISVQFSS